MRKSKPGAFRRGIITARFLAGCRHHVTSRDLQAHLETHGEVVTLRSCQRYLLEVEAVQPLISGGNAHAK